MSIEGCAHLLNGKKPISLIGGIIGGIESTGKGWIKISTFLDAKDVRILVKNKKVIINFTLEMAMSIAGFIFCLVKQNNAFREQNNLESLISTSIDIDGSYTSSSIEIGLNLDENFLVVEELKSDEQIMIVLYDNIAEGVADFLFELLGKSMANTANAMLEKL